MPEDPAHSENYGQDRTASKTALEVMSTYAGGQKDGKPNLRSSLHNVT
jgi:hypothetical protein